MSAETLRRAAALMRELAEAATPRPWDGCCASPQHAAHVASWHPTVALAVAAWLNEAAEVSEEIGLDYGALAVANAYLQETP